MSNSNPNIDNLLVEAMNSEIKAKEFYEDATTKAESQAGKKLFKELSEFEQNHYERVKKIIENRDKGLKIEKPEFTQDIPMIRSEVTGEFENNKDEIVTIINLAIESEKNAHERYKRIAEMIDDEDGKNVFNDLAMEERNHQRILEDEFYQLSNQGTIIWE